MLYTYHIPVKTNIRASKFRGTEVSFRGENMWTWLSIGKQGLTKYTYHMAEIAESCFIDFLLCVKPDIHYTIR